MGEAILKGWLASTYVPAARIEPADVVVVEPGEERRAFLSAEHGVTCVADASLIEPGQTDVVVLSVKPQVMMNVLETVSANPAFGGGADGPLFISIARPAVHLDCGWHSHHSSRSGFAARCACRSRHAQHAAFHRRGCFGCVQRRAGN